MKYDILIIAAGNQTRFKDSIPKVLYDFKDSTVIQHNIDKIKEIPFIGKIHLVISDKSSFFDVDDIPWGIEVHRIKSGFGCGDAVLTALEIPGLSKKVFIQWGDCLVTNSNIYNMIIDSQITIPVKWRKNPYVSISLTNVLYSKLGEVKGSGYQDLSVFFGETEILKQQLEKLYISKKYETAYLCKSFKEINFLDIIKLKDNKVTLQNLSVANHVEVKSFNTIEELKEIERTWDD